MTETFEQVRKTLERYNAKNGQRTLKAIEYVETNRGSKAVQEIIDLIARTGQIDIDTPLIGRVLAGTAKICPICNKYFYKGKRTCSKECSNVLHKKHYTQTCLQKYGATSFVQTDDFKAKSIETCLTKYNVKCVAQVPAVREKIRHTMQEKYGAPATYASKDLHEKCKQACIEKYGVPYATQSEQIKNKIKQTNLKRYGTEYACMSDSIRIKIDNALQANLLNELNGCKNYEDLNEAFIQTFIIKINGKEYFDLTACKNHFNVNYHIVWRIRNCFHILKTVLNYFDLQDIASSQAEKELFEWIPTKNKIHNDRNILKPYELDIVLPDVNLAIEYDGLYWHNEDFHGRNYHLSKTEACEAQNYTLFHIFETDNIDIWKSMINGKLGLNKRIFARKCTIQEVSAPDAKLFCAQNHLQGCCPDHIRIGLFYNNELVEIMTFGRSRFNKHYQYELLRLCTKKYCSVIGGASKLFKYFLKTYDPASIISYANRRFSKGNIYKQLGFEYAGKSAPNYWYFKGTKLLSRNQCQKHKLIKILETFDPNLSEAKNMKVNGYLRIFDCGNLVFSWKRENINIE